MKQTWIWLNKEKYPEYQFSEEAFDAKGEHGKYCVAEFKKNYKFGKPIKKIHMNVSGDTFFRLWLNGELIGEGPVNENHDFESHVPNARRYFNYYDVELNSEEADFRAEVQLTPVRMLDFSKGHGGFMLEATAELSDGTSVDISTNSSWLSRKIASRSLDYFDGTATSEDFSESDEVEDIWNTRKSPIPMLRIEKIKPSSAEEIFVPANSSAKLDVFFDRVYSAHIGLDVSCNGKCFFDVKCYEKNVSRCSGERMLFTENTDFQSMQIHSIGAYSIQVKNESGSEVRIKPYCVYTCYPVEDEGYFKCSDEGFNKVFDVCKWTTQICRQTTHLDSPLHQEPLACTGDYNIEMLITAFCYGDMKLSELDVFRTAEILRDMNGKMFHTTYSLIWVQMLYDTYMFSGNKNLLSDCKEALEILLRRFDGYIGENGIIDNPPDYMFVDWMVVDGFSMHHPPKCLGQTCLNAFYFEALNKASLIMDILGDGLKKDEYHSKALKLKECFNSLLFDSEKGLYFDGLNTPSKNLCYWLPQNVDKRYYSRHSNTLAVLYGLCDGETAKAVMEKVMNDKSLIDVQPYFMHYVLCALRKSDLFGKYGMEAMNKWKEIVGDFSKGLREGWYKPEEGYDFDYSHAWGGTPAYQLMKEASGLEITEPGYKKITLKPSLCGLDYIYVSIPTPFGHIVCDLKKGRKPQVFVPDGIEYTIL